MQNEATPPLNTEEELPFFARFLNEETTQETEDDTASYVVETRKYPSDWEDF